MQDFRQERQTNHNHINFSRDGPKSGMGRLIEGSDVGGMEETGPPKRRSFQSFEKIDIKGKYQKN